MDLPTKYLNCTIAAQCKKSKVFKPMPSVLYDVYQLVPSQMSFYFCPRGKTEFTKVEMPNRHFKVLAFLMEHKHQDVSLAEISENCYDSSVRDESVVKCIYAIKKLLPKEIMIATTDEGFKFAGSRVERATK